MICLIPPDSYWSIDGEGGGFLDDSGNAVPGGEREILLRRTDLVNTPEGQCPALKIEIYPLGAAYGCLVDP